MTFSAESQAIESRFNTNWGSTTPIKFDNVNFNPTADTTFVELQIFNGPSKIAGFNGTGNMHRMAGIISINIYGAINSGTRTLRGLCDTAAAIFRDTTFSTITCSSVEITRIGQVDDWFVYNVSIPYYRNENF